MPRGGKQTPLPNSTKSQIIRLYQEKPDLNVKAVAQLVGCATSTAWNILVANGIEIRGASKWLNEKAHKHRILRRWDSGQSSSAIAQRFALQRQGVARLIAASRPYDERIRQMLKAVFGEIAETRVFLVSVASPRNAGRCAICRSSKSKLYKNYSPQTGTLRDLLCMRCSQGLGCFNNDAATLVRATAYLIKHSAIPGVEWRRPAVAQKLSQPRHQTSLTWGHA